MKQSMPVFKTVVATPITRKQFLVTLGSSLLALTSLPSVVGVFTKAQNNLPADGFGGGDFGGNHVDEHTVKTASNS